MPKNTQSANNAINHNKVDQIDKRIIFELSQNARLPETKLAKALNVSKEVIRYRMKKLEDLNVITGYTIWVDVAKLGYQSAKIYFNFKSKPKRIQEFITEVKKDKRLYWLGIAQGAWNAGVTYFVKDNHEFFELKNELLTKYNDIITSVHNANLVDIYYCQRHYLTATQTAQWKTFFSYKDQIVLDELSKNILKELLQNSRIRMSTIAQKYNATLDMVRQRMKKMQQQKVIARYTIGIDHKKLGQDFYKTFVYFQRLSKQDFQKFLEFVRTIPGVIHCVTQISPWDIELETMAHSYEEYHRILEKIAHEFSEIIQRTQTAIMREDYVFPAKKLIFE